MKHEPNRGDHQREFDHRPARKRLHRDWRAWGVVGLMLAAMAAYVLTNDEFMRFLGRLHKPNPASSGQSAP